MCGDDRHRKMHQSQTAEMTFSDASNSDAPMAVLTDRGVLSEASRAAEPRCIEDIHDLSCSSALAMAHREAVATLATHAEAATEELRSTLSCS